MKLNEIISIISVLTTFSGILIAYIARNRTNPYMLGGFGMAIATVGVAGVAVTAAGMIVWENYATRRVPTNVKCIEPD